ncbi:hypothetical protein EIP86_011380 [Pleurotus ostreatoroseus]|nr:hypothetical protein EIP86_011380 [Pleurotus ostreatoroseus]
MIQKVNPQGPPPARPTPDCWGSWGPLTPYGSRKYYSLEVVQHPIRARMCGFGDKVCLELVLWLHRILTSVALFLVAFRVRARSYSQDRRPLAPAAVAKMVVRREDNSVVDVDEVDCSFFLVTVDLWSSDGDKEMNLVLHPTSSDRYIPSSAPKAKRRATTSSVPAASSASTSVAPAPTTAAPQTPVPATPASAYPQARTPRLVPSQSASMTPYMPPYSPQGYFPAQPPPGPVPVAEQPYAPVPVAVPEQQPFSPVQYTPPAESVAPTWGYAPPPAAWPEPGAVDDAARAGEDAGPVDYHTWPASERFAPMEPGAGEYGAYTQPPPPPPSQQAQQSPHPPTPQQHPQTPATPHQQPQQQQQSQAQAQAASQPLDTSIYASASRARRGVELDDPAAPAAHVHAHARGPAERERVPAVGRTPEAGDLLLVPGSVDTDGG